jgi:hypothetical protein
MLAAAQKRQTGTSLKTEKLSVRRWIGEKSNGTSPPIQGPNPIATRSIAPKKSGIHERRASPKKAAEKRKNMGTKLPAPTSGLKRPSFQG